MLQLCYKIAQDKQALWQLPHKQLSECVLREVSVGKNCAGLELKAYCYLIEFNARVVGIARAQGSFSLQVRTTATHVLGVGGKWLRHVGQQHGEQMKPPQYHSPPPPPL